MSRKIIIPKGLLNPNETAIIEIPPELEDERNLMVSRKEERFSPASTSTPNTITRITKNSVSTSTSTLSVSLNLLNSDVYSRTFPSANDQCPGATCPINLTESQSKSTPKLVKKKSSKATIRTSRGKTGQSSLGILGSSYMNSRIASRNQNFCYNPECTEESLGLLKSEASDTSNLSDDSSSGLLGPGNFDSTDESFGILGPSYFDSTTSADESLGILGPGYFDSTRGTTDDSLGILGPGYFDSTRDTTDQSLGILGPGYFDSTRTSTGTSLGILGPGYFDSTRSTANDSLGLLISAYLDSIRSAGGKCSRDCTNVSKTTNKPSTMVTKKTSKTRVRISSPGSSAAKFSESFKSPQPNVSPPLNNRVFSQSSSARCPVFNPHTQILENMLEQSPGRLIKKQSITKISQPCSPKRSESEGLEQKLKEIESNEKRQLGENLTKYQNARRNLVSNATLQATKSLKSARKKTNQSSDDCPC